MYTVGAQFCQPNYYFILLLTNNVHYSDLLGFFFVLLQPKRRCSVQSCDVFEMNCKVSSMRAASVIKLQVSASLNRDFSLSRSRSGTLSVLWLKQRIDRQQVRWCCMCEWIGCLLAGNKSYACGSKVETVQCFLFRAVYLQHLVFVNIAYSYHAEVPRRQKFWSSRDVRIISRRTHF